MFDLKWTTAVVHFLIMRNEILYIGLHGYAGSGKDTVAKALRLMLSYNWNSFDEFRITWENEAFKMDYATFGVAPEDDTCYCIAFADQLKQICSVMFGIPVEKFYYNKENAWICITDDFQYTERQPLQSDIITAEQYYYQNNSFNSDKKHERKWMSLREVLVYIGTYVCQCEVNKHCFVNGVSNTINHISGRNRNLKYVICTDVRFHHELEFIKKRNGINIDIIRDGVDQLNNVAEHNFDYDENVFDFTLNNDGTYDELLVNLWDLVHENIVFQNITISLPSRDSNNYLRKIDNNKYQCCFEHPVLRISREEYNGISKITMIDPSGGPAIHTNKQIDGTSIKNVSSIYFDDDILGYVIDTSD